MARKPALRYDEKPVSKWNAANFRQYLADLHAEKLGLPYVARNIRQEAGMLRNSIDEYGAETVKALIDAAFDEYRPTREYPTLNYAFIYSYMRQRIIPKLLADRRYAVQRAEALEKAEQAVRDTDVGDVIAWL